MPKSNPSSSPETGAQLILSVVDTAGLAIIELIASGAIAADDIASDLQEAAAAWRVRGPGGNGPGSAALLEIIVSNLQSDDRNRVWQPGGPTSSRERPALEILAGPLAAIPEFERNDQAAVWFAVALLDTWWITAAQLIGDGILDENLRRDLLGQVKVHRRSGIGTGFVAALVDAAARTIPDPALMLPGSRVALEILKTALHAPEMLCHRAVHCHARHLGYHHRGAR